MTTARTPDQAEAYVANFQARVLQDAWAAGWAATWERRARALEDARPRPGDFHGQATREQLRARHERLTAAAAACRARATGADGSAIDALHDTVASLRTRRQQQHDLQTNAYARAAADWQATA